MSPCPGKERLQQDEYKKMDDKNRKRHPSKYAIIFCNPASLIFTRPRKNQHRPNGGALNKE